MTQLPSEPAVVGWCCSAEGRGVVPATPAPYGAVRRRRVVLEDRPYFTSKVT